MGLLFGYYSNANGNGNGNGNNGGSSSRDVSIVDAEEMQYPTMSSSNISGDDDSHRAAILQKIELHQKVFPQHKVVGWYRVTKDNDANSMADNDGDDDVMPTEDDLRMNQTEMARYCRGSSNNDSGGNGHGEIEDGEQEGVETPLFVLMNASKTTDSGDSKKKPSSSTTSTTNNASEEMEVDEELPLTVYETLSTSETGGNSGAVFVNVDFELETYEPERIAVEKVFKTQPSKSSATTQQQQSSSSTTSKNSKEKGNDHQNRKMGKKSKNHEGSEQSKQQQKSSSSKQPPDARGPTELDGQIDSLQSSIRALNIRMNVLLEFLQMVKRGEIADPDDGLLRSVDGLVRQLPLVLASLEEGRSSSTSFSISVGGGGAGGRRAPLRELENEMDDTMLLTYLAAVAKTARSVHVYSEKFRTVVESGKSDPRRPLY